MIMSEKMTEHPCPNCGEPITKPKRKYCCMECRKASTPRVVHDCEYSGCGKTFWRYQSQLNPDTHRGCTTLGRYCSPICYQLAAKELVDA